MLTTEELLRDRYKVIGPYPWSPYKIGDIITMPPDGRSFHLTTTEYTDEFGDRTKLQHWHAPEEILKYKNLFQPLPWWSDREISDLPAYVKVIREDCIKDTGLYCKVYKWSPLGDKWPEMKGQVGAELEGYSPLYLTRPHLNYPGQVYGRLNATHLEPATLAEYEAYNQQKEGMR